MILRFRSFCFVLMFLFPVFTYGENLIPLGSYAKDLVTVDVILNDNIMANFIVDTGSSFVVVGSEVFLSLENIGNIKPTGTIKANIANGTAITLLLYNISSFAISGCVLHDVEIAVNATDNINIVGWTVLDRIQPITFDKSEMILTGTRCE